MPRHARSNPPQLPPAPRILCIRLSALGDTLLTFPAVAALRARYSDARIGYLTDSRQLPLLRGCAAIDEPLGLDRLALKRLRPAGLRELWRDVIRPLARGGWDVVVDMQSYTETAILGALTRARVRVGRRYKTGARWLYRPWIDAPHPQEYMPFAHLDTLRRAGLVGETRKTLARYFDVPAEANLRWSVAHGRLDLPPRALAPRVGLFVGAAEENRRWAPERYAALARELQVASGLPLAFLVFAGPAEDATAEAVLAAADPDIGQRMRRAPTGDLLELAAAFSECAMTVSNDTGPLHLSIAMGTPTCGIYRRPLAHFLPPAPHARVVAPERDLTRVSVAEVAQAATPLLPAPA